MPNGSTSASTRPDGDLLVVVIPRRGLSLVDPRLRLNLRLRLDLRRRLAHLANNNSALDLKSCAAGVWLLGTAAHDLANNNLASAQVFILQGSIRKPPLREASCKQQLSGLPAALA